MIRQFISRRFRCFENFTLDLADQKSVVIIGKNGSGKTTLRKALGFFQSICRGSIRARDLFSKVDFSQGRTNIPMRFEIEVALANQVFQYVTSFEMPSGLRTVRM